MLVGWYEYVDEARESNDARLPLKLWAQSGAVSRPSTDGAGLPDVLNKLLVGEYLERIERRNSGAWYCKKEKFTRLERTKITCRKHTEEYRNKQGHAIIIHVTSGLWGGGEEKLDSLWYALPIVLWLLCLLETLGSATAVPCTTPHAYQMPYHRNSCVPKRGKPFINVQENFHIVYTFRSKGIDSSRHPWLVEQF